MLDWCNVVEDCISVTYVVDVTCRMGLCTSVGSFTDGQLYQALLFNAAFSLIVIDLCEYGLI